MNDLDGLIPKKAQSTNTLSTRYATVLNLEPLTIIVDGDDEPLEITPSSTVDGIIAGDSVMCTVVNDELIVTGIVDGAVDWIDELSTGVAAAQDAAATAASQVATAVTAANGKSRIFWGPAEDLPTDYPWGVGDVWFDSAHGNQPYTHDGITFIASTWGDAAIGNLNVAKLVGDTIQGNFVLGGSIKTNTVGARVEQDSAGIRVYDGGGVRTVLGSDGESTFDGKMKASILEVSERLKINSPAELGAGATLTIQGGVSAPASQPVVEPFWDYTIIAGLSSGSGGIYGICRDGATGEWIASTWDSANQRMKITRHHATSGALVSTVGYVALQTSISTPQFGVGYLGGQAWVMRVNVSGSTRTLQLVSTSGTVLTIASAGISTLYYGLGIGQATGTQLSITYDYSTLSVGPKAMLIDTSTGTTSSVFTPWAYGGGAEHPVSSGGIAYGAFDFGANSFVQSPGLTAGIYAYNAAGARTSTWDFPTPENGATVGVGYYGGLFWTAYGTGMVYTHTTQTAAPNFSYAWYDSKSAGTGVHETGLSPWSNPSTKRSKWKIGVPSFIPGAGDDDVDNVRIYARIGTGTAYLQETSAYNYVDIASYSTATARGSVVAFPATNPGQIVNQSGDIVLPGNGPAVLAGINRPINLPSDASLNSLPQGLYWVSSTALTGGYPRIGIGNLEVFGEAATLSQRYTSIVANGAAETPNVYVRTYALNTQWSAWQRIDPHIPGMFQTQITTSVAMGASTNTVTDWPTPLITTGSFSTSTGTFTANVAGYYTINCAIGFSTQSTRRFFQLVIDGSVAARFEGPVTGYSAGSLTLDPYLLSVGSTVLVQTYGAAAPTIAGNGSAATFSVRLLARL